MTTPIPTVTEQIIIDAFGIDRPDVETREWKAELEVAIGGVLFSASNYPERVQPYILGQYTTPLRDKLVQAVLSTQPSAAESPDEPTRRPGTAMSETDREFYAKHYSDDGWTVEELHITAFVPTASPGNSLTLVNEILNDASFDIRVADPCADPEALGRS